MTVREVRTTLHTGSAYMRIINVIVPDITLRRLDEAANASSPAGFSRDLAAPQGWASRPEHVEVAVAVIAARIIETA